MRSEYSLTNRERLAEIERNAKHLGALLVRPEKEWVRDMYVANINEQVEALRKVADLRSKSGSVRKAHAAPPTVQP